MKHKWHILHPVHALLMSYTFSFMEATKTLCLFGYVPYVQVDTMT